MPELRATINIQGMVMNVISSSIEFSRKTDNKGRPVTGIMGGHITIIIESTKDTKILETMVNGPNKAISGKIVYYKTEDDSRFRVIEFKYAYIVYYKEAFNIDKKRPMISTITLSADIIMIGNAYLSNKW